MLSLTPIKRALGLLATKRPETEVSLDIYQGVSRQLLGARAQGRAYAIGLTSASAGEGVTTLTVKLALSAAKMSEKPVLLVDCNMSQPQVEQSFGLRPAPGLRDALSSRKELSECIRPTGTPNLAMLGPGTPMRGSDLTNWNRLLEEMTRVFGLVLFDVPPVSEFGSQPIPLNTVDGMVLVIEAERARRKAVARAKSQLERDKIDVLGVILNKRQNHVPDWIYKRI